MLDEKITFDFLNLHLQEPVALLTNWMMCAFSIYAYSQLKNIEKGDVLNWRSFFLWFSISAFFGGIGHLFFQYLDVYGKFPNWIATTISGYYAGNAIITHITYKATKKKYASFLVIKSIVFLLAALVSLKFAFVAIDAIITYIMFCGVLAWRFYKKGITEMKYFICGVMVSLPSVFIFFLNINPHRWLNKDDLSHLFLLGCIYCFYLGAKKRMENKTILVSSEKMIAHI
ncbi:MAG: hypothetical protein SGJ10_09715 [Bacteroidota bacterium]|nr:hypothetical protein [Bacteroidota bacterium]